VAALVLSGAAATFAQFGGSINPPGGNPAGNPTEGQASDQRVFPNGLPKIESMLKSALEHHPQVLASRSKLRAAEAELRQSELAALKDVMDVRARWEVARRNADDKASRENLADLAAIEWELAFLLGTRGDLSTERPAGGEASRLPHTAANIPATPAVVDDVIPRGEQAEAIKEKLGREILVDLEGATLAEVAALLGEQSGLRFILDKQSLEDHGFPVESPISLKLGDVELGTALQALEDLHKPLYFVIRDYGILVTTTDSSSYRIVSARDFWKLTDDELRGKLRQQRLEATGFGGMGGMGGMGGGGMGGMGGMGSGGGFF
jgi:hypothetical protein